MSINILADIGNTHIHIYENAAVKHLSYDEAIKRYAQKDIQYISVRRSIEDEIKKQTKWQNISSLIELKGAYQTMGVDRRALCLSHPDGVFVDAGSAITVDVMEGGVYQGGFILPGIRAMLESYSRISPILSIPFNQKVSTHTLPMTTKDGISYGIIASIKTVIATHQEGKQLYFTGGDGAFLSSLFDGSVYDETLVFEGMQAILKGRETC